MEATLPCVMDKRFWNNQMCVQFLSSCALLTSNLAGFGSLPAGFWLLGQELKKYWLQKQYGKRESPGLRS